MKKITIDLEKGTVYDEDSQITRFLNDPDSFSLIGDIWLRTGWDSKYVYSFTWLGRPIIQQPEDMFRIQELIYQIRPDFIIETGIAHGGSLIFYASLCKLIENGEVIGIDIEIRPHNLVAIENHELNSYITMIESTSTNLEVIKKIENMIRKKSEKKSDIKTIVILDSGHTKEHVLKELELYSRFVNIGSYIIACDGHIKELVCKGPRSEPDWYWNNPRQAAIEFVKNNSNFIIEEPKFLFNEGIVNKWISYWSGGFVKRIK